MATSICSTICLFRRTSSSDFSGPPSGPTPSCQSAAGSTPPTSSLASLDSSPSFSSASAAPRSTVKPSTNSMRIAASVARSPSSAPFLVGFSSQSSRRTWCSAPSAWVTPLSGEAAPVAEGPAASTWVRTTAALARRISVFSSSLSLFGMPLSSTPSIVSTHRSRSPATLTGFEEARTTSFSRGSSSSMTSSRSLELATCSQTASVTPPPRPSAAASPVRRSFRAPLASGLPPSKPKKLLIAWASVWLGRPAAIGVGGGLPPSRPRDLGR
mmetsp:Transcript_74905/g.193315  ORF Transcript_74905/g.193315 Transcript_74905/m.193315 type:complete len:270 (-) Transcript_74905:26-835(-)